MQATAAGAIRASVPEGMLFNRELSWLAFNRRVLAEAENEDVPLLERLKFLAIASSNLDEFLMVRVGGIRELVSAGVTDRSPDGLTPKQQLRKIRDGIRRLLGDLYTCLAQNVLPGLRDHSLRIVGGSELTPEESLRLEDYFRKNLAPVLTPLAIDPGHPFPAVANLALNVVVRLESARGEEHVAIIKVPPVIQRLIATDETLTRFIPAEVLIELCAGSMFPGLTVRGVVPFRVVRNADISIREDEVEDLLKSIETEVRRRERKSIIWLEVGPGADETVIELLTSATGVSRDETYVCPAMLRVSDLMQLYRVVGKPSLRDVPFNPRLPAQLATAEDIFSIIASGDVLLHRPYDSFTAVVELVQAAADDPDVLAIKQTLYRVDSRSPIIEALSRAALQGKQVTVIVELQARFDEQQNIAWARRLEDAGVQVVYGIMGVKTHCKLCLVVRREGSELRRYVHLSTGNYNAGTARLYTDIDLFTVDEPVADDAAQLMNLVTGFSINTVREIFDGAVPSLVWKKLIVAPMDYHAWVLRMIAREAAHAGAGRPAQIIARMNALVDPAVIAALYAASQAGVKIDLIIRGICCLAPGVAGLSENIRVLSIVDRFLEHSRLFLFRNGGDTEVYASSGDWMPRNFFRRFEVTFPILDQRLRNRVENEILSVALADREKAWKLQPDGSYRRRARSDEAVRSQEKFIAIARSEAVRVGPYEEIINTPGKYRRKAKKSKKRERNKGGRADGGRKE